MRTLSAHYYAVLVIPEQQVSTFRHVYKRAFLFSIASARRGAITLLSVCQSVSVPVMYGCEYTHRVCSVL